MRSKAGGATRCGRGPTSLGAVPIPKHVGDSYFRSMKYLCLSIGFGLALASPAWANRCAWDPVLNESRCCTRTQQAIYNSLLNEVECVSSQSGDSCAWDDVEHQSSCCATDQHAVWNEVLHEIECHTL
jgi:hypothetical protein